MSNDLLAAAIANRIGALFQVEDDTWPPAMDDILFVPGQDILAAHQLDSVDLLELVLMLEEELGVRLSHRDDLGEAASLRGLADYVAARANGVSIQRFCRRWAPGQAEKPTS